MSRLLCYMRPYKWRALTSLALTLLSAPLMMAGPPLTMAAVDVFLAPDPSRPPSGFGLLLKQLAELTGFGGSRCHGNLFIALVFLLANVLMFVTQYAQLVAVETLGQHITYDLREEIFAHLQRLPIQFYDRNPMGRLMTRLTTDVDAINEMFTSGVIVVLGSMTIVSYIVIWMFLVDWRLALASFVVVPLLAALATWFRLGARSLFREVRARIAGINAFLQEHITCIQVLQLFNREAEEMRKFDRINKAHREAAAETVFYTSVFYPAVDIAGSVMIALIIWYGGGRMMRQATSVGTLIAFMQLVRAFNDWVLELSEKYNILQAAMASSERIFKLLDEPVTIKSPGKPVPIGKARGRVEFRNVWFAYEGDNWVLKDFSFVAEPGEKVAFVGHTGAGKTTITNLLLRFYEIQRGQILFDDVDIRELDLQELRSNFSIVLQDVFLCSGDIASNIRFGNQSITDDMVESAARAVHADGFIRKLEEGYRTKVLERGAGLSVGQKQLIGFTRALASDPCVLILDEATSSIDTETEIFIREAVERLMAGRTSLIIAHRLSTIHSVNKIVVMRKGEVYEIGNHQSLLAKRGLYWRLYQLQFYQELRRRAVKTVADD
ncbi:MAG TPA: ABC transporter ATP-binding protein [Blastocatellia bacterium]|nr:ABC transporter ATP-binding protein [Blastocatellia bacterium]